MSIYWVLGLLGLLVLGVVIYLKLRPGWVAASLERRPEQRGVCVTLEATPHPLRALFLVEVSGIAGARGQVRTSLARIGDDSDLVMGLCGALLDEAFGRRAASDPPFGGVLDEARRGRAVQAFREAGLELVRLEVLATRALDELGEKLARIHLEDATPRGGTAQRRCSVLDFLLDGRSGLGHWSTYFFENGVRHHGPSTQVVKCPDADLKLVPAKEGGLVYYQSLAALERGAAAPPEL